MSYRGHPDQRWGHVSYAQHGDDFFLLNLFELLGVKAGRYLDLGAHHPVTISNTKLLYDRGWSGVNVEANPMLVPAFEAQRPRDVILNVGVATVSGRLPFHMIGWNSGRNTFSQIEKEECERMGFRIVQVQEIPVMTVGAILTQSFAGTWPELLTMDIEGFDFEVLDSADFGTSRPMVVCVETRLSDSAKMRHMMRGKGFHCVCRIAANLFFVDERMRDKLF